MNSETKYEQLYNNLLGILNTMHADNVRKTKVALKSLLIVPTIFLIMLFLTSADNKSIYLILWIASMFFIAAILIIIEYQDYKLQMLFKKFTDSESTEDAAEAPAESISDDGLVTERVSEVREMLRANGGIFDLDFSEDELLAFEAAADEDELVSAEDSEDSDADSEVFSPDLAEIEEAENFVAAGIMDDSETHSLGDEPAPEENEFIEFIPEDTLGEPQDDDLLTEIDAIVKEYSEFEDPIEVSAVSPAEPDLVEPVVYVPEEGAELDFVLDTINAALAAADDDSAAVEDDFDVPSISAVIDDE